MKILALKSKTAQLMATEGGIEIINPEDDVIETDVLIRWGSRKQANIECYVELNKSEAIARASDKALSRQLLAEAGIPVPTASEALFPVVGRIRKHRAGSGFFLCNSEQEVTRAKSLGAVYFSQYYPKQNEYRVHIAGGKCLLVSVKDGDKNQYIWNKRKSGFKFRHMHRSEWLNNENLMNMVRIAKKAMKVIGLDFGAVDCLTDAGDGFPPIVVSELNTAPSMSPLARSKYLAYFESVQDNL